MTMVTGQTPILVTGGSGQVGGAIAKIAGNAVFVPARVDCDLADPDSLRRCFAAREWSAVVSAGAYTAVDKAESDRDTAFTINAEGPAVLAALAAERGIPIVHVSTDYVFDGSATDPYREDDMTGPLGVYGASKLAGEAAVRAAGGRHIILRTAWVQSAGGANFVRTMLRLGAERDEINVVADQHGTPTGADDIAATILSLIERLTARRDAAFGTYHFTNGGATTWHGLASAVFAWRAARGYRIPVVNSIATSQYPTPARRPASSVLSCEKIAADHGIIARPWTETIAAILTELELKEKDPR